MKSREHRRKVREAEYNALRQKEAVDHWRNKALEWRTEAANCGSMRAMNEIQFEEASKKTFNGLMKQIYSDYRDYRKGMVGLEKMLEFIEPPSHQE